ncbi:MAG: hypothetical protein SV253_08740 [Halobacteria archaeon]|nr:hypothetical protein [Halobacteria archaeon]
MSDIERVVDETREFEDTVVRAVILEVPESEKYPDGYKIRFGNINITGLRTAKHCFDTITSMESSRSTKLKKIR